MGLSTTLSSHILTKVDAEEWREKAVPLKHLHRMGLLKTKMKEDHNGKSNQEKAPESWLLSSFG